MLPKKPKENPYAHVQVLLVTGESVALDFGKFGVIIESVYDSIKEKFVDIPNVFFDRDEKRYSTLFFDHWEEYYDQGIHLSVIVQLQTFKRLVPIFSRWRHVAEGRLVRLIKEHFKPIMKEYHQRNA